MPLRFPVRASLAHGLSPYFFLAMFFASHIELFRNIALTVIISLNTHSTHFAVTPPKHTHTTPPSLQYREAV